MATKVEWKHKPDDHDYPAAKNYPRRLARQDTAEDLVARREVVVPPELSNTSNFSHPSIEPIQAGYDDRIAQDVGASRRPDSGSA